MKGRIFGGKFEVLRVLGRGGFGVVCEAYDHVLDRSVALKTLRDDVLVPEQLARFQVRFRTEARGGARPPHPHTISTSETGIDDDVFFIAMELVPGRSLADILAERGRLPLPEVMALATSLLRALDYAHERGIVHRDVKPANVLIRTDGVLKIADFGLAKLLTDQATVTQESAVVGTPAYIAPEQLRAKPPDARTDLYSAAAVLFHAVTGRPPFVADNLASLLVQVLHDDPPSPPPELDVPSHVALTLRRALSKDPAARHPSCAELLHALVGELPASRSVIAVPCAVPCSEWTPPAADPALVDESGPLDEGVPHLLLRLRHQRWSGLLVIENGRTRTGLDLRDGKLLGISGGPRDTCLGRILEGMGLLGPDDLTRVLELKALRGDAPLGELAVRLGVLGPGQVLAAMQAQLEKRLEAVLGVLSGRYTLYRGLQSRDWQGLQSPPLEAAIAQDLRTHEDHVREIVTPFLARARRCRAVASPDVHGVIADLRLPPRVYRWARQLDGRPVREILDSGVISSHEAELALYLLWAADAIALLPPVAEPPAPPPAAAHAPSPRVPPGVTAPAAAGPRVEIIPQHQAAPGHPAPGSPAARSAALEKMHRAGEESARYQHERAKMLLTEALELDPESPEILLRLGWATLLSQPGIPAVRRAAQETFERLVRMRPGSVSAKVGLAKVARLDGRYDEALRHVEGALALDSQHPEALRELRQITRMPRVG